MERLLPAPQVGMVCTLVSCRILFPVTANILHKLLHPPFLKDTHQGGTDSLPSLSSHSLKLVIPPSR